MGLNIERWIRTRLLRLPAKYNSLDDVLKHPGVDALKRRGWELLERELRRLFERTAPTHQIKEHVWAAIERNLDLESLPAEAVLLVHDFVERVFRTDDPLVMIEEKLVGELRRRLGL